MEAEWRGNGGKTSGGDEEDAGGCGKGVKGFPESIRWRSDGCRGGLEILSDWKGPGGTRNDLFFILFYFLFFHLGRKAKEYTQRDSKSVDNTERHS